MALPGLPKALPVLRAVVGDISDGGIAAFPGDDLILATVLMGEAARADLFVVAHDPFAVFRQPLARTESTTRTVQ